MTKANRSVNGELLDELRYLAEDQEMVDSILERFKDQLTEPEYAALEDLVDFAQRRVDELEARLLGERLCSACREVIESNCWSMAYKSGNGESALLLLCPKCAPGLSGVIKASPDSGFEFFWANQERSIK